MELRTDTVTDTQTHRHMDRSTYLKMDLKSDFFDLFQTICFWKAESLCFKNLLEFLGYEVKREKNQLALRKSGEFFRAKILVKSSSSPDRPARLGYRRG